jgi:hypothetical protein
VEQGNRIVAVLPGVEFGTRPLKRFYAMPEGCYGRLFFTDSLFADKETVATSVMDTLGKAGYMKTFVYDFYDCFPTHKSFKVEKRHTTLVDVSSPDWLPSNKQLLQQICSAQREGIQIEEFSIDKHFSKFLALMEATERRHGRRPKYPPAFFKKLARLARDDCGVLWIWCEHEGQAAASHIYFVENDMVLYWQPYFDKAFSFLKPNQYMLFSTAQRLVLKGVKYLNLGASPHDASGLIRYKKKWGGKPYRYNCYLHQTFLGRLL